MKRILCGQCQTGNESRSRPLFLPVALGTPAGENAPLARTILLLNVLAKHNDVFGDSNEELE